MAPDGIGDRLEGIHAVAAAVDAGRVTRVTVEATVRQRPEIVAICELARTRGATVAVVEDVRPLAVTSAPQGVVAEARPIRTVRVDDLVTMQSPAAVIVLDHLEDGRNVGAIARSSLGAGVPAMVVAGRRAAPLGPAAFKAAAGAFESISVAMVGSVAGALDRLRTHGLWLVGLDGRAETTVWECDLFDAPVALVVGSEGRGLSRLVADRIDLAVRVPIGGVESLNAAVAASVVLFELARRRAPA